MLDTLEPLVVQARQLASGTIASLTGETFYTRIDAIRDRFVEFCETTDGLPEKWQDAWAVFRAAKWEFAHGTVRP